MSCISAISRLPCDIILKWAIPVETLGGVGINGDADKAKYLAVCLRGQAQSLLGSLQRSQLSDYTSLVDALQERFGLAGQTEIFMAELQTKSKSAKETHQELADNIVRLVGKAYPSATGDTMRILSVQHFIKALTNKDLRVRIKLLKPATIREAVLAAIEFEAIEKAEQSAVPVKQEKVRKVTEDTAESKGTKPKKKAETKDTVQQVQPSQARSSSDNQLAEVLKHISTQLSTLQGNSNGKPRQRRPLDQVECFRCLEKGHFASRCEASSETVKQRQDEKRAQHQAFRSSTPSKNE